MGAATLESDVHDRSSALELGVVVGDYRIDGVIGSGGMATVYRATHSVIGKRVAIKVMHRTKSDTAVSRFVKEARAVNVIEHPNIVDVFGFGMTDQGRPYLVMELLEGETLAVRATEGPLTVAETCEVLIEVTHALEAAHDAGIVHRDLKPENIFLARRKHVMHVKLLDFGIAKLFGDGELGDFAGHDDTRPGVLIGTPRYISPEQVRGAPLDGRVDIYALGVVAFELLAGRQLFTAANHYDMFQKHAKLRPPRPSACNPALPAAADALILEMLAKEPSDRPTLASIRDQLAALREAAPGPAVQPRAQATDVQPFAAPVAATTTDVTATSPPTESEGDPTRPVERRSFVERWAVRGLAVAAVAGVLIAIAFTRKAHAPAAPPPPAVPASLEAAPAALPTAHEVSPAGPASAPVAAPVAAPVTAPTPAHPTTPPHPLAAAHATTGPRAAPTPAAPAAHDLPTLPAVPTATTSPAASPTTAGPDDVDTDDEAIEIDPVTHVATPSKRTPSRTRRTRTRPATPAKPAVPDDDAVRSPFEPSP